MTVIFEDSDMICREGFIIPVQSVLSREIFHPKQLCTVFSCYRRNKRNNSIPEFLHPVEICPSQIEKIPS